MMMMGNNNFTKTHNYKCEEKEYKSWEELKTGIRIHKQMQIGKTFLFSGAKNNRIREREKYRVRAIEREKKISSENII